MQQQLLPNEWILETDGTSAYCTYVARRAGTARAATDRTAVVAFLQLLIGPSVRNPLNCTATQARSVGSALLRAARVTPAGESAGDERA
jgi:hypothetical protein